MTIEEMQKFSVKEIENFSIEELQNTAQDLLEKVKGDSRLLPVSVTEKLIELCAELPEDTPKLKKEVTVQEACQIINAIVVYFLNLPAISEKYSPIVQRLIEVIINFFT